ncbi:MAG: acetyl-CoA carboxylase biotin carboxyl carrier protein subunit [Lunatimonas sp.]|uniref:acetyl-CoA carboxylase biotin carboxyl carrier protein subunit n=1 Tax=Lunatimonas sp. TaxID=2060141 RepID=UPI00263BA1D1|nr:acetyl-CoA carboxylase biotin carboxyl carrier protein subunit [Lunatimonas sp.]MCC5939827.1 acetyl-CoA carboxylase biotin carboxyl carrier protein subunit [Lunatimonas sp.]
MYKVSIGSTSLRVEKSEETYLVENQSVEWDVRRIKDRHYHILYRNRSLNLEVISWDEKQKVLCLKLDGKEISLKIQDPQDLLLEKLGIRNSQTAQPTDVKAPMPGLILNIPLTVGQTVRKGETLLVLEAMKMENAIKAPLDGTVKAIAVQQGQSVEKNQVLVQF